MLSLSIMRVSLLRLNITSLRIWRREILMMI
jgi:hypothetical protein